MKVLRSVTSRLVFFYCLLLVVLGGTFLFFTALSFRQYTRETAGQELATRTQLVWNTVQGSLDQPQRLQDLITRRFASEAQDRFIRIRAGAKILYRSGNPVELDFNAAAVPLPAFSDRSYPLPGGDLLLYSRTFNSPAGPIAVDVGQSFQFARRLETRLVISLLIGLPLLLLLAALAGYMLMRRALVPVEVMINAAETYSFNDPHNRLPLVGTEPRIEALGLALNRMLDRLDNAYDHVSRFSADAAHELRTPLTIIRGEMELAMAKGDAKSDIDRAMSNALEEMTRLSGIVDSLITLSRMDSLWGKRTHSSINLLALALETIDQMNLLAVERQIALEKPSGLPIFVAGDRDRLKQVMVNLVANAIKYTRHGGRVTVRVTATDDMAFFAVEDDGIGIDADQQERVFDRFYRVSTDRGDVGAGLGLAIVRSICHAHGGTVTVKSVPEMGSIFTVALPLAPSGLPASADTAENKMAAAGAAAATRSHT
jgi:signal transduction histidine kinase